jgi:hypothetical protein
MTVNTSRYEVESQQKWREEVKHIPFIQFPVDWKVQIIPPFGDAVIRFRVKLPSGMDKSVYLDVRDSLGCVGSPYWEVYPYHDDIFRCPREDVTALLEAIADETPGEPFDPQP